MFTRYAIDKALTILSYHKMSTVSLKFITAMGNTRQLLPITFKRGHLTSEPDFLLPYWIH